jgi:hypothetical protein
MSFVKLYLVIMLVLGGSAWGEQLQSKGLRSTKELAAAVDKSILDHVQKSSQITEILNKLASDEQGRGANEYNALVAKNRIISIMLADSQTNYFLMARSVDAIQSILGQALKTAGTKGLIAEVKTMQADTYEIIERYSFMRTLLP